MIVEYSSFPLQTKKTQKASNLSLEIFYEILIPDTMDIHPISQLAQLKDFHRDTIEINDSIQVDHVGHGGVQLKILHPTTQNAVQGVP